MKAVRWAAAVAVTVAAVLLVGGASHVGAQVPPITVPGQTTTTEAPPPATTEAPTTTPTTEAESTPTSEATATSDTLTTDTTVAVPAAPDVGGVAPSTTPTTAASRTRVRTATTGDLAAGIRPASVSGAYGLGLAALIAVTVLLIALTTHVRSVTIRHGGTSMNISLPRRARLIAGFSCLALAAIVGLVGYLKLSLEPDVNRQIPYLASAGMALVLLSALGGALVVGEQMRTDEQRIVELEAAVQSLAAIVSPSVEAPPRHDAPAIVESGAADAAEAAEAAVSKPRRSRS